jgi:hypothetical protein
MDSPTPLPFPHASIDPIAHDLVEIDAAIDMVARGLATRIQLIGLTRPEAVAPSALAQAQRRGVAFTLDRRGEARFAVTIGPSLQAPDAAFAGGRLSPLARSGERPEPPG